MALLTTQQKELSLKFRKAINYRAKSPLLSIRLDPNGAIYPKKEKDPLIMAMYYPYSSRDSMEDGKLLLEILPPYRVVQSNALEQKLMHTITRTKFANNTYLTTTRFRLDLNKLNNCMLSKMINFILTNENPRVNYSWIKPLQDIVINNELAANKRTSRKGLTIPQHDFGDMPVDEQFEREERIRLIAKKAKATISVKKEKDVFQVRQNPRSTGMPTSLGVTNVNWVEYSNYASSYATTTITRTGGPIRSNGLDWYDQQEKDDGLSVKSHPEGNLVTGTHENRPSYDDHLKKITKQLREREEYQKASLVSEIQGGLAEDMNRFNDVKGEDLNPKELNFMSEPQAHTEEIKTTEIPKESIPDLSRIINEHMEGEVQAKDFWDNL